MAQDLLLSVRKPARYIGEEFNLKQKSDSEIDFRFAICFPGLYELGMSNLGLRIIYGLLNSQARIACERFFLPDIDMLALIKAGRLNFTSLESKRRLLEFDIVGFSVQHELDYTNILNILEIGKIPFYSRERNELHPLIIAGGPALSNPEPLADFFDCFVIGEAEEVLLELITEFKNFHDKLSRPQLLEKLSRINGVYVPQFYEPEYAGDDSFIGLKAKSATIPSLIKQRFVRDLDTSFYPIDWLVPYIAVIQDRIMIELMRGCPHECNFCQARSFYYPFRIRSKEKIIELAIQAQARSGYEEISLLGLSCSDHPQIQEIVNDLIDYFQKQCVGISLGSLRPTKKMIKVLETILKIRKTGLTLAIESASSRMRQIINKQVDIEAVKALIAFCYNNGYRRIKFYFMYGLPFETDEDLAKIPELIYELFCIEGKFRRNFNFSISINPFIPKPNTVFQWLPMDDLDNLKRKQKFLKSTILRRLRNAKVDFRNIEASFLEALLSRGDRRLSKLIFSAFENGAVFDGSGDCFNFSYWQQAIEKSGIDVSYFVNRQISLEQKLPWEHIDANINSQSLKQKYLDVLKLVESATQAELASN
jgi:radical SAM family uncharacterized protein